MRIIVWLFTPMLVLAVLLTFGAGWPGVVLGVFMFILLGIAIKKEPYQWVRRQ